MNTNQPWSRRSRSVLPRARSLPCSEITCAVPVLPATSRPATFARRPVPAPLTTIHRPSRTADIVSGFSRNGTYGLGGAGTGCQPLPSSNALTSRGTTRVPPLATVAIITASAIGVTSTMPWPIATEIVSPAYHFSLKRLRFHSCDGHDALDFVRQVDAALAGQAQLLAPLVDAIDAEHVADRVEVGVARLLDGVPHVHPAVLAEALEEAAVERAAARAENLALRRDHALLRAPRSRAAILKVEPGE